MGEGNGRLMDTSACEAWGRGEWETRGHEYARRVGGGNGRLADTSAREAWGELYCFFGFYVQPVSVKFLITQYQSSLHMQFLFYSSLIGYSYSLPDSVGAIRMQGTVNENAASIRRICQRPNQPKMKSTIRQQGLTTA